MRYLDLPEHNPVALRIRDLATADGVSDFYLTPGEPLSYKYNGQLIFDEEVFEMELPPEIPPGHHDSALDLFEYRFRVNQMVTQGKLRWVMRLLPSKIPRPQDIKVPPPALKAFLEARYGLFLVCGPTGSGKSTTIASMVKHRAMRRREHVISFEDPIEFVYPDGMPSLISQREMGSDEMDFGKALRASLRQAPDVIIIGEIRDGETAEIALQASETGHVVVASLHTSSVSQTVQRFLKLIPSDRLENAQETMADMLRLVVCQRLLLDQRQSKRFPIHEVMLQYDGVINIIRRGDFKKLDQELETGWKKGMFNFAKSAEIRGTEGFEALAGKKLAGNSWEEIEDYLESQQEVTR